MSFWRFGLLVTAAHAQQCVTKQLISPGDGVTFPKPGDTVSMQYTGTLASTGAKFDSSLDRGKEFSTQIGVGQVIQGWDQGVPQMSLGEHAILRISAACGYGAAGSPPVIPANADLVFDVSLNGINGRRAAAPTPNSFGSSFSASASSSAIASAPIAAAPTAGSSGALPRCATSSQCGHAISFDTTGASRPLCLCNPLCQQWATTPGILPCCPGLQEVCLDPYRSSTDAAAAPVPAPASYPAAAPASYPAATPASYPAATPASYPAFASASYPAFASASFPAAAPASFGASASFGTSTSVSPASFSAAASTQGPISQAQFNAQFGAASMQQMSSTLPVSTSIQSASSLSAPAFSSSLGYLSSAGAAPIQQTAWTLPTSASIQASSWTAPSSLGFGRPSNGFVSSQQSNFLG